MGANFNRYYYDTSRRRALDGERKSKIEIATESIVAMLSHLNGDDRFGVVLFDDRAYRAKSLRELKFTNRDAIKAHILALKERGGTDWSAGYREAIELFNKIEPNGEYENRIIFLTDAMPNSGELRRDRLFGLARSASDRDIHTTFIGVGVDFNSDLVEYISKVRGANYFTVNSSQEFKKLLDREFNYYGLHPLVLRFKSWRLESRDYEDLLEDLDGPLLLGSSKEGLRILGIPGGIFHWRG